jgi:hypothetical protein
VRASRALPFALAAALFAGVASAAPARIAVVRPEGADAIVQEAVTRLQAELGAAGFEVVLVDEAGAAEARPFATVAVVRTERGAAADVRVADPVTHEARVRRVETDATGEAHLPTALAIRAVEVVRASVLEAGAAPERAPPAPLAPVPHWTAATDEPPPPPPRPPFRALLERVSVEVGVAALYGMGDTSGRLAPTLRFAYGLASGLAGRLTVFGPTATDQTAMLELAYGFDRSWHTVVPALSLGAGAGHTGIEAAGGPASARRITQAWAAVLGGSAGVAARVSDRTAFLLDVHALLSEPTPGAIVGGAPAAGKPELVLVGALGVVAGF